MSWPLETAARGLALARLRSRRAGRHARAPARHRGATAPGRARPGPGLAEVGGPLEDWTFGTTRTIFRRRRGGRLQVPSPEDGRQHPEVRMRVRRGGGPEGQVRRQPRDPHRGRSEPAAGCPGRRRRPGLLRGDAPVLRLPGRPRRDHPLPREPVRGLSTPLRRGFRRTTAEGECTSRSTTPGSWTSPP